MFAFGMVVISVKLIGIGLFCYYELKSEKNCS